MVQLYIPEALKNSWKHMHEYVFKYACVEPRNTVAIAIVHIHVRISLAVCSIIVS